jgi:hypothetical protein
MRHRLFILFSFTVSLSAAALAQTSYLNRYDMPETGAKLYLPSEPSWVTSYSPDSSIVYNSEVLAGNNYFGTIVVKFAVELGNDEEVWEDVLKGYMKYLNTDVFQLKSVSDFESKNGTDINPYVIGVQEYGKDAEGSNFTIRAWTNNRYLAVMYISYTDEIDTQIKEQFLNGFQFP